MRWKIKKKLAWPINFLEITCPWDLVFKSDFIFLLYFSLATATLKTFWDVGIYYLLLLRNINKFLDFEFVNSFAGLDNAFIFMVNLNLSIIFYQKHGFAYLISSGVFFILTKKDLLSHGAIRQGHHLINEIWRCKCKAFTSHSIYL